MYLLYNEQKKTVSLVRQIVVQILYAHNQKTWPIKVEMNGGLLITLMDNLKRPP